jgi:TRAP transporter 4TM/12TM fusion protein
MDIVSSMAECAPQSAENQSSADKHQTDDNLHGIRKVLVFVLTIIGVGASIFHLFGLNLAGHVMWPRAYYSLLIGCFLPIVFITTPFSKKSPEIRWFDFIAAIVCMFVSAYFFFHAENIEYEGWEYVTPTIPLILTIPICILVFEAARRSSGGLFFFTCLLFSSFPLFTENLPGILRGVGFTPLEVLPYYIYGTEALYGIPMKVLGELLIGFLLFAVTLQHTGGGKFFLDLAFALVGDRRGGPAKVAVLASAFFGSLSGSAIANVTTTGAITIPAMKRLGYSPHYAGAVEACASTGGVLMPPIMGATVFIMAQVLGISYATIMVAAFIPATLYYASLLFQVDAYAAKKGLEGLSKNKIPRLRTTLKDGWPYLFSLAYLVFQLFYLRTVSLAPYYASALLLVIIILQKKKRFNVQQWIEFIIETGRVIASLTATLLGVGFIIGALLLTGVAYAFSNEVILLAGDNTILLLGLGAIVSFVLGMGLTISACYILLALTMAPPLVTAGFDPLGVHLFVMYCGMLSFITPPVALSAFAASGIAGSSPIKTGVTAMRLGIVLYIVPFVFVLKPALIFNGPITETFQHFLTFILGIYLLTSATEGYFGGVHLTLKKHLPLRIIIVITGVLLIFPETYTDLVGIICFLVVWRGNAYCRKRVLQS